jgi:membrane protein DedA with SNARE-associated domain
MAAALAIGQWLPMTLETIILRYGLVALFLGAGLEGETVVMLGGLLAHRGLIDPVAAAAVATAGSFVADQGFFLAGRHFRQSRWMQKIIARPAFAKALASLEHHPTAFILGFRFLYGLRTISPAAVGTSHVAASRFMILNLIAAAIWGPLFTALGYLFGNGIKMMFGRFRSAEHLVLIAVAIAVAGYGGWRAYRWTTSKEPRDSSI